MLYLCGLHKHPQCDSSWQIILLHNEIGILHRRSKEVSIIRKINLITVLEYEMKVEKSESHVVC